MLWLRRDLRLADSPALLAAQEAADRVLPLFVLDDALRGPAGAPRLAVLYRTLRAFDAATGSRLVVRTGDPSEVVAAVAREVEATSVHVSADCAPYGRRRDAAVAAALEADGRALVRTGSPYAVGPGTVRKADGTPFRVYTPFRRAWQQHGWPAPAPRPARVRWEHEVASEPVPDDPDTGDVDLPAAGEEAGLAAWQAFREQRLAAYPQARDRPAAAGTSRLSVHLKYGSVHPRTVLADLGPPSSWGEGEEALAREVAFRDFYADVLWHAPGSVREPLDPRVGGIRWDDASRAPGRDRLAAWKAGRTGFPFVDAGMRQLAGEAWVHNRVRMVVASFLVKDLHLDWREGARHFMAALCDGDVANNQHGWQWVAGTGTDAAPFFRVFNPVLQGEKFDPDGDYVRRWVPELRDVPGGRVHTPWELPGGLPDGYPERVVDHRAERLEALARYQEVKA